MPRFVLDELQAVADSADKLKRNRGRRGLDVLTQLRESRTDVILYEPRAKSAEGPGGVDQKLMDLAKDLRARVLTNDYNLNKVAQLSGVDVININDLSNALKPVVLPGEKMTCPIVQAGRRAGPGGRLSCRRDDGGCRTGAGSSRSRRWSSPSPEHCKPVPAAWFSAA